MVGTEAKRDELVVAPINVAGDEYVPLVGVVVVVGKVAGGVANATPLARGVHDGCLAIARCFQAM